MTAATADFSPSDERTGGVSQGALLWGRLRRKRLAMISLVVIIAIYGAGIFAPLVAPYSYRTQDLDRPREGPSAAHWLGTDLLGRDLLSRAIYSARTTVIITVAVIISGSLVFGVGLGLFAGYRGGKIDSLIMRVGDIFAGLPAIMMLILINAALGDRVRMWARWMDDHTFTDFVGTGAASYLTVFAALALFEWVGMARIIRAQVLQLRERDFVTAARATGAAPLRIVGQHLLPNVSNLVILSISVSLGGVAGTEIFLTWFGVGVQPPAASFGAMLFEASSVRTVAAHPHLLLVPASFVVSLLFAFALLGEGLNDAVRGR
jgi:ABC-type dipeptide/oligopeptide/nickel transport system permease subunit